MHIDELIIGLWKTYIKYYKDEYANCFYFLSMIINEIMNNNDFIHSKFAMNYMLANKNNSAPLIMFAASFYFNHKYQKIKNLVSHTLNKKFNEI